MEENRITVQADICAIWNKKNPCGKISTGTGYYFTKIVNDYCWASITATIIMLTISFTPLPICST